jgi:hypothetical protein
MSKFILRLAVMFLTFTIGLAGHFLGNGFSPIVESWLESPDPVLCDPSITIVTRPEASPFAPSCGLLVVAIDNDHNLTLNGEFLGSAHNPSRLAARLNQLFSQRAQARMFRPGCEQSADSPNDERIEKTVLIKATRWISYGEVSDLIDVIKATGAQPIGLLSEGPFIID